MKKFVTNIHLKITAILAVAILSLATSCKKFLEIPPPITQVVTSQVFSSDQTATASVTGLYSEMMQTNLFFMNGAMTLYPGLSADELRTTSPNVNADPFAKNAIPSNSTVVTNNIWRYAYSYIYQVNAALDGLSRSNAVSPALKQALTGELKFDRAVLYFYLVNLFGPVPLVTGIDYNKNAAIPRTDESAVYAQIVKDLKDAQAALQNTSVVHDATRPSVYAATALLARVYLYQKDWQDAAAAAGAVISSGKFSLVADPNGVFLPGSSEAIWQLVPVSTSFNTAEGASFIPISTRTKPPYAITAVLLNAFEPGDLRLQDWTHSNTVGGVTYSYPYKYKVRNGTVKTEYSTVIRLAEMYLVRAEALAQRNDISDAINDVNTIRNRAGLLPKPATLDQADCLAAIAQENRIEFFAEWGHRWLDLKRTGTADSVLGSEKTSWTATDALYPIPFSEIQSNPRLTQNPGY